MSKHICIIRGTMPRQIETDILIIGGGISGLAAARRLYEAHRRFILVTDRMGGRMYHSPDKSMNLGATYINSDYKNVSKYVGKGQKLKLHEIFATNGKKLVPFFHPANLKYSFPFLRLIFTLFKLRIELNRFRKKAEHKPQAQIISEFPLIHRLSRTSATTFIKQLKLEALNERYSRYVLWTTCFSKVEESNALFYLGVLFPLIIRTYMADFTDTYNKITDGFNDNILIDKIVELSKNDNSVCIARTSSGRVISSESAIIAVPYHNAHLFYNNTPKPYLEKPATVLYVQGQRKGEYRNKNFILLNPEAGSVGLIWKQKDGRDLLFSLDSDPDLSLFYSQYKELSKVTWKTAVVLSNGQWCPTILDQNIFLAGDYNICGMEDSYISGVCAANQILNKGTQ